jgi:hypothetical protein
MVMDHATMEDTRLGRMGQLARQAWKEPMNVEKLNVAVYAEADSLARMLASPSRRARDSVILTAACPCLPIYSQSPLLYGLHYISTALPGRSCFFLSRLNR